VISTGQVLDVFLACVLLIAVPGPSVLFVVGRALSQGRRVAIASSCGNAVGCLAAGTIVALGLGPLLARWELLLLAIRLVGGAYLIYLGVSAIGRAQTNRLLKRERQFESTVRALRRGFVVGITNPKALVIFAVILPEFIRSHGGPVPVQLLVLAVVPCLLGLVTDTTWALAAGGARTWFTRNPRRESSVERVGGLSMIGLGCAVVLSGTKVAR